MAEQHNNKWFDQIKSTDVSSDGKHDDKDKKLQDIAIEMLNSEDVRKRSPEFFNKLVKEVVELLKRKNIDEIELRDELRKRRQQLYLDIQKNSSKNADKRSLGDKIRNKFDEFRLQRQIEENKEKGIESILDYDNKKGNHIKTVKDFEDELKREPLGKINSLGLANYLIWLNNQGKLSTFLKDKLSTENRESIISILYDTQGNNFTGASLLVSHLKSSNQLQILKDLSVLAENEIISDFKFGNAIDIIFYQFGDKIQENKREEFIKNLNSCKSTGDIIRCFAKYDIVLEPSGLMKVFKEIHKDFKKEKEKRKQEHLTIKANLKLKIDENSSMDSFMTTDKLKSIPKKFHKIKIINLTKSDWEELDKLSFLKIVTPDVASFLISIKQNNKIGENISTSRIVANDKIVADGICNISKQKGDKTENICVVESIIDTRSQINEKIESKLEIINKISGFEGIQNIYEILNDEAKINSIITYLKGKGNKNIGEKELLNYLTKDKPKSDKLIKDFNKKIEKENKNYDLEQDIQNTLLKVIQSIPGYSGVTHVGDIMHDKYALDWAIKYLSSKKRTQAEQQALNKLVSFRGNIKEIDKIKKENPGFSSVDINNKSSIRQQADNYVASNNNFYLGTMSSDRNSRKIFFDALFNYIDSHGDSVKSLKSIGGIEFKIRKDLKGTYKINYGDREMKSLTREQAKDSVSFAVFLEPLGLIDLIPYSSRIIEEINKKSNGKPINDRDGMNDEEKKLCLVKLGQAIIPGYKVKPELKENEIQFIDMKKINTNIKGQEDFKYNGEITSLSQLIKLRFPTNDKNTFDIQSLLKSIPS